MMMLTSISYLEAQERQRIAVIPFNPVNIPKDEAEIIYTDFESIGTRSSGYWETEKPASFPAPTSNVLWISAHDLPAVRWYEEPFSEPQTGTL